MTKIEDCRQCPYNMGMEQGAAYICGPCGQQNCWLLLEEESYENGEEELR